jgi:hypothetical protein
MDRDYGNYLIQMDGRWTLDDLYRFPRTYEQIYFALDALVPSGSQGDEERVARAFQAFPWQGGYSAVNFYNQLKIATPVNVRPKVASIRYASPGWIELSLILEQAQLLAEIVGVVAASIGGCNAVYNKIISDLTKRKLLRIEVEKERISLSREELRLVKEYSEEMAELLQLGSSAAIDARTDKPLISLKILLSVYRRVRILADYKLKRKAVLPIDGPKKIGPPKLRS